MSDDQLAIFRRIVNTYPPHWAEETDALQAAADAKAYSGGHCSVRAPRGGTDGVRRCPVETEHVGQPEQR